MNKKEMELQHEFKMKELAFERETKLILLEAEYRLENPPQAYYPQQHQLPPQQHYPQEPEPEVEKSKKKYGGAKK